MLQHNFLIACLIAFAAFDFGRCDDQEEEQIILKDLLHPYYDKRVRPSGADGSNGTGGPTIVETNFYVRDIDFIDEQKHMYGLQLTYRQKWLDKRLAYNTTSKGLKFLTLLDVNQVWTPDTFFANDKESRQHDLMKPNHYIRIFQSGEIIYSSRISLKLSCMMAYKNFPFDNQTCSLRLASYGYINKEVLYKWKEIDPVQITSVLAIPNFDFDDFAYSTCDTTTNTGTYSCLKFDMMFTRTFSPFLVNVYIPCTMMVIAAWLATFLDKRSVTARTLAALSTLYVMTTLVNQFNSSFPTVAYTKAIDVWTGICLTFVFSTFWELVIIIHLSKSDADGESQSGIKNDLVDHDQRQGSIKAAATKWLTGNGNRSEKVESVFRTVYPIAFVLFAAIYFMVY